jgi:DNA-directed RNA polymerase subunit RPC12/RpoP
MSEIKKRDTGICLHCGGSLELVELDSRENTKVMKCQDCGRLHLYKRDFLGSWKIVKVTKEPSHTSGA